MNKKLTIFALTTLIASAFAFSLSPIVYADSGTQMFRVTVTNPNSVRVEISDPEDGKHFSENPLEVSFPCINISSATITVTNKDTGLSETRTYIPTSSNEIATEYFDLEPLGGYGEYIVDISGVKDGVIAPVEATASVTYTPTPIEDITIDPSGAEDPTIIFGDPIDSSVDHIEIQLYSQPDKKPLFDPVLTVSRSDFEDGKYTLPFSKNEIPTGDYKIGIAAYDVDDNLIYETFSDLFHYTAPIKVPDTGTFLKEIGMSGTSFTLILTAVFIALGIAFFIIVKNKKDDKEDQEK